MALRDLYRLITGKMPSPDRVILMSRVTLVITISIALGFALLSNDIISYITKMISILITGMCVCGLLGRFWSRYNWQGALATLVSATLTALAISLNSTWSDYWGNPVLPTLAAGFIAGVLATLVTPADDLDAELALARLANERQKMEEA